MHREIILHSSDLNLPPNHPLYEHLFILKEYAAPPSQREAMGIPPDDPNPMYMIIEHRHKDATPYATTIPVADDQSFAIMWNAFARNSTRDVLRGYGLEHLCG